MHPGPRIKNLSITDISILVPEKQQKFQNRLPIIVPYITIFMKCKKWKIKINSQLFNYGVCLPYVTDYKMCPALEVEFYNTVLKNKNKTCILFFIRNV